MGFLPRTRLRYRSAFSLFMRHCKIEDSDLSSLVQKHPRLIEAQIIGYIRFLAEEKRYTRGSIAAAIATVYHFFEMNDVLLNKNKVNRFLPEDETDHTDRAYTHEEIQQMLLKCDERTRVIILLMTSTGMRIGAVYALQIGNLERIPEYDLYRILVYANFPRSRYYTFCTPECAAAIDSYMAYRKRFGDPLEKRAPLIREQFEINDPFTAANPKPISERTVGFIITEILKRSGLRSKDVTRAHGFRKFAISTMIKAKVDYNTRGYLVGRVHTRKNE